MSYGKQAMTYQEAMNAIDLIVSWHLPSGMPPSARAYLASHMQAASSATEAAEILERAVLPMRPLRDRWFGRVAANDIHPRAFRIELTPWAEFV